MPRHTPQARLLAPNASHQSTAIAQPVLMYHGRNHVFPLIYPFGLALWTVPYTLPLHRHRRRCQPPPVVPATNTTSAMRTLGQGGFGTHQTRAVNAFYPHDRPRTHMLGRARKPLSELVGGLVGAPVTEIALVSRSLAPSMVQARVPQILPRTTLQPGPRCLRCPRLPHRHPCGTHPSLPCGMIYAFRQKPYRAAAVLIPAPCMQASLPRLRARRLPLPQARGHVFLNTPVLLVLRHPRSQCRAHQAPGFLCPERLPATRISLTPAPIRPTLPTRSTPRITRPPAPVCLLPPPHLPPPVVLLDSLASTFLPCSTVRVTLPRIIVPDSCKNYVCVYV
eukprot:Rmarinus@m.27615